MSSPLYNVVLHFHRPHDPNAPTILNAVKEILAVYYECEGLDYPCKVNSLAISSRPQGYYNSLSFIVRSPSAPVSTPQSNLKLKFKGKNELFKLFSLLPLDGVQDFTAKELELSSGGYYRLFRRMKNLPRLQLVALDIGPALEAMRSRNQGVSNGATETPSW